MSLILCKLSLHAKKLKHQQRPDVETRVSTKTHEDHRTRKAIGSDLNKTPRKARHVGWFVAHIQ